LKDENSWIDEGYLDIGTHEEGGNIANGFTGG